MLFTWDTTNLCIVFRSWHIRSTASLLLSLIAVVFLAMGYEGIRALSRAYEARIDAKNASLPSMYPYPPSPPSSSPLPSRLTCSPTRPPLLRLRPSCQDSCRPKPTGRDTLSRLSCMPCRTFTPLCSCKYPVRRDGQVCPVAYASRLVFMTYNGWVMMAVTFGAFLGYVVFGHGMSATKDGACH